MKLMTLARGVLEVLSAKGPMLTSSRHEAPDEQIRLQNRVAELESVIREVSCFPEYVT